MKNLKPFDLQAALSGKAVMLRNGDKAYVRYHETELTVEEDIRLAGFTADGSRRAWCENGDYYISDRLCDDDIIGMYPETRVINGFEVPAPETEELEYGTSYYLASLEGRHFLSRVTWDDHEMDRLWLKRGLAFLNKEDAIATAKAMLGIDPYSETE